MSKIWVLQHTECETLGTIADALEAEALAWQCVRVFEGKPVPAQIGDAGGLILMGGPMGVYEQDRYPHLKDELRLIDSALKAGKPVLGVCLGSQLLAAALGAVVARGSRKEIGWYPVRLSEAAGADRLWSAAPTEFMALHWHGDAFDLPQGAVNLASSELTAHQAFRYGKSAYGFLFHLEMTEEMIAGITSAFGEELREAGGDESQLEAQSAVNCDKLQMIGETVFSRWARLVHEARIASTVPPYSR
ncbi:MAG TPA: gamma-glutamyl-gamma-aminobutyrate hydrolase family protein [Candidatus Binataceae bacterium]|nr:gamma-glutamyl-gamma-aminobutyrate hydrolase family protein [Candidatus Binataceae bacterium]